LTFFFGEFRTIVRGGRTMMATYLINEMLLRLVERGANVVLRLLGGPDRVPQANDDLVWY
jgi:hypothetical protein